MSKRLLSDSEIFARMMSDPDVRARAVELVAQAKVLPVGAGITAEQLPAFLRDLDVAGTGGPNESTDRYRAGS